MTFSIGVSEERSPLMVVDLYIQTDLHGEGSKDDGAEDGVGKYPIKDVPLAVDLASVDLVEKLHQDEGVEDDGVVLRWRRVQGSVTAAVDVKHALTWRDEKVRLIQPPEELGSGPAGLLLLVATVSVYVVVSLPMKSRVKMMTSW